MTLTQVSPHVADDGNVISDGGEEPSRSPSMNSGEHRLV